MANELQSLDLVVQDGNSSGTGNANIPLLSEEVDGIDRIKLLDVIWSEVKGVTTAVKELTEALAGASAESKKAMETALEADRQARSAAATLSSTQNVALIQAMSQIFTGKTFGSVINSDNNVSDVISKVITGKSADDLVIGVDGEYDTTLNGRIQKTTEIISGMMVGIFTEDEIKEKLSTMDINKLSSIEENLGSMEFGASFMKNNLKRNSSFTEGDGDIQRTTNPLLEIERGIKALVLSYAHGDLKGDIKMAELRHEQFPGNIPQPLWDELKHAYAKATGDFIKTINEYDPNDEDNHDYGDNLNITDDYINQGGK